MEPKDGRDETMNCKRCGIPLPEGSDLCSNCRAMGTDDSKTQSMDYHPQRKGLLIAGIVAISGGILLWFENLFARQIGDLSISFAFVLSNLVIGILLLVFRKSNLRNIGAAVIAIGLYQAVNDMVSLGTSKSILDIVFNVGFDISLLWIGIGLYRGRKRILPASLIALLFFVLQIPYLIFISIAYSVPFWLPINYCISSLWLLVFLDAVNEK